MYNEQTGTLKWWNNLPNTVLGILNIQGKVQYKTILCFEFLSGMVDLCL